MARKISKAETLTAQKRWLAAQAAWLEAAKSTTEDRAGLFRLKARVAYAHFEVDCAATSQLIETLTPRSSPFKSYKAGFNCKRGFNFHRRKLTGAQKMCDEAVSKAKLFKKPVRVTGFTLGNERHTVLEVNEHGEVTFKHPQFKVRLPEIGGTV